MNEELKIIISAQAEKAKKALKDTKDALSKMGDAAKKAGEVVGKGMQAIGKATQAALKTVTAVTAAAAAAMVGLSESTREYRTEQAKLVSAFETAGASAEQAKTTYNDLYRVLGDGGQATEAANHLAQLTTNEQDLAEWTNICQGVYATFGDSLPIEGLTEAANETAKVGQVTGGLADALNWAGVSEDAFNASLAACNTEAEREALIRETLNGIYSDAAANYEKNAGSILSANEAQAKLTDAMAQLGAVVEPIVTIFKVGLADALSAITPHLTTVAEGLTDILNGVDGGAEKMASGISGMLTTIVNTVVSMLPTILSIGINIVMSLIEGIVSALPSIVTAIVEAIPMFINGVVSAVTAIIEALPTIIQTIVSALPTLVPALIDGIINMIVSVCNNFSAIIEPIIDILPDLIISIIDALMNNLPVLIDGLIALILGIVKAIPKIIKGLVDAIPTIVSSLLTGIMKAIPQIIGGLISVVWEIVKAIPQIFGSLLTGVVNFFKGIWNALGNVFAPIGEWFGNVFGKAVSAIKKAFSSVTGFFKGIWDSIKSIFSKVGTTIGNAITNTVKKAINGVLSVAVKIINGFISAINLAIKVINAIPGVNIRQLSKLNVPKLAKGGIIDSTTLAVVGEQGKEAVVPLENNLGWLDKMASMLADKMGANNLPIALYVDGKMFAKTAFDTMNNHTKQTGKLDLVIV